MPNPKRAIAAGRPLYHSFVDYFGDDVSGNRSKSWNKHWNAYTTHRNLPRKLLQQEFHVHFVSTSPNASISEQYREFNSAVESTHTDPVEVQDESGDTTCFCIYVNGGPSDNPMQSEVSGHIGGKGNRFCRKCEVGGTQKEKSTNEGYHALFEAGAPRTKEKIIAELEKQVKLACSGIIKPIKDLQTQTGVKDMYTQYWIDHLLSRFKEMKNNEPDRSNKDIQTELIQWTDTPVEILHTILLGVVKYIWHISHTPWSPEKKKIYSLRLQSTATDGLSIHGIHANYIMQYAGSLIGRQIKTLAQMNVLHVYGLVTDHQFMAWKAAGELAALLWVPEIWNLNSYRRDLKVAVANVLDIFSLIDPSKIITKIKLHPLAHIDDDAAEFGPLVGVATEIFESFNAIFRYCSIFSNHLAPSRDIALQLGDQEGLKHRLTGEWWFCRAVNEWRRAGPGVRQFLGQHPVLQKLLGWSEPKLLKHVYDLEGEARLEPLKRGQKNRPMYSLRSTTAVNAVNYGMHAESLDECFVGSWIFVQSATDANSTICGRISEILRECGFFRILSVRDNIYGMPVLVRRDGETIFHIISAKNLKFKVNVQHDCYTAKCEATGERLRMQERVESDQIENFIIHEPLDRFIINSHAFHNAHLLQKHDEFAATPRENWVSKVAKRKAAATDGKKTTPRKRKGRAIPSDVASGPSTKRRRTIVQNSAEQLLEEGGLVAGREKRVIKRTEGAKSADEQSEEGEDTETSTDDDSDIYNASDDCSD
ncbi:hypothetical protein B0H13DRAFT_2229300 [Mycena leptocephala]|nr:hypothetical protein B0H13DRAFT_2229300 [Mycena leptocephala]